MTSNFKVLHPKMIYRFKAVFSSISEEDVSVITDQITWISPFTEIIGLTGGTLSFKVRDDVSGALLKALTTLKSSEFMMQIVHLNGSESVISSFVLKECAVSKIIYSAHDYSGGGLKSPRLRLTTPKREGDMIENLKDNPISEALTHLLNGMELTFEDPTNYQPQVIEHTVHITFNSLEITS